MIVMGTLLLGALLGAAAGMVLAYRWPRSALAGAWIGGGMALGTTLGVIVGAALYWAAQ
jgi:hypothetical protein